MQLQRDGWWELAGGAVAKYGSMHVDIATWKHSNEGSMGRLLKVGHMLGHILAALAVAVAACCPGALC
jgi:hypothetical protein